MPDDSKGSALTAFPGTLNGSEGFAGFRGGLDYKFLFGTHIPYLVEGTMPAEFLPLGAGLGDMQAATFDPAGGAKQVAFAADLANAADGYGAELLAYFNPNNYFSSAADQKAVNDAIATTALFTSLADVPAEVTALEDGDQLAVFGSTAMKAIDWTLPFGTGPNNVFEFSGTDYSITTADRRRRIIATGSGDSSFELPLLADEALVAGDWGEIEWNGIGIPSLVCGDASIILNGAADGVMAASARNTVIRWTNIGADKFNAVILGTGTTTDATAPEIISWNPPPGSPLLPDTILIATLSEAVTPNTSAGTFIGRQDTGGGFGDLNTWDVTDPLGTDPGEMDIDGNVIRFYPGTAWTAGASVAMRNTAGAVTDFAGSPNDLAAVADDTTYVWPVAEASTSNIEVVSVAKGYLDTQLVAGTTQTKTIATPSNGDMNLAIQCSIRDFNAGPTGFTAPANGDYKSSSNPGGFIGTRIEGGSPSNQIVFTPAYNKRSAWVNLTIRGTGGTLAIDASATPKANASAVEDADAPSLVQGVDAVMRVAVYMIDTKDVAVTTAALQSAGWGDGAGGLPIVQTTEQGSLTAGCTLVVAVKAQGGAATDSVDPPAVSSGAVVYRSHHITIKETA